MRAALVDDELIGAWLAARSVVRGLPAPIPDRGGLRVDTGSEREIRRWLFPKACDGLREIGAMTHQPRNFVKLCGGDDVLRAALPARWEIMPSRYLMTVDRAVIGIAALPAGYRLHVHRDTLTAIAEITAPDGSLAASGHAAETAGVFIYDRIETAPNHRRLGLGRVIMQALGECRQSTDAPQVLVATDEGRALYATMGWIVAAPYATAVIPG